MGKLMVPISCPWYCVRHVEVSAGRRERAYHRAITHDKGGPRHAHQEHAQHLG